MWCTNSAYFWCRIFGGIFSAGKMQSRQQPMRGGTRRWIRSGGGRRKIKIFFPLSINTKSSSLSILYYTNSTCIGFRTLEVPNARCASTRNTACRNDKHEQHYTATNQTRECIWSTQKQQLFNSLFRTNFHMMYLCTCIQKLCFDSR